MLILWLSLLVAGALAGVLAGLLGIGGGIVLVPVLMYLLPFAGVEDAVLSHAAVATSLASIVFTGSSSAWRHHRLKAIDWSLAFYLIPGLLLGAILGTFVAPVMSSDGLRRLIAILMVIVAFRLLFDLSGLKLWRLPSRLICSTVGVGIGAVSALCGIGGGSLTVPFLTTSGVDIRRAVAVSAACGVPIAVFGTLSYLFFSAEHFVVEGITAGPYALGLVVWPAVLTIASASVYFAQVGARLAHQLPVKLLRRIFGLLLVAVSLRLLLQ